MSTSKRSQTTDLSCASAAGAYTLAHSTASVSSTSKCTHSHKTGYAWSLHRLAVWFKMVGRATGRQSPSPPPIRSIITTLSLYHDVASSEALPAPLPVDARCTPYRSPDSTTASVNRRSGHLSVRRGWRAVCNVSFSGKRRPGVQRRQPVSRRGVAVLSIRFPRPAPWPRAACLRLHCPAAADRPVPSARSAA